MSGMYTSGLIGLTEENVGIDRRFYTNRTDTNPTLAVSYNNGRVDVYLNGVKLVGNHAGNSNHDYTMDNVTGTGTTITLATGVALTATDVLELVGYVSNSSNTVQTYNFNVTTNTTAFTASHTASSLVNVYLNGVLLDSSDYTLNGSDTVTLGSNAVNGDVVAIQVIGALDHSNFVPIDDSTFTGNIKTSGEIHTDDIKEKTSAHGVEIDGVTLKDGGGTFTDSTYHTYIQARGTGDNTNLDVLSLENDDYENSQTGQAVSQLFRLNRAGAMRTAGSIKAGKDSNWGDSANVDGFLTFSTAENETVTERMRINSAGNVTVSTGNLVIGTAGKGIDFTTSSNYSGKTDELLDDYEEGIFTITASNSVTLDSARDTGCYTKIGQLVYVSGQVKISSGNNGSNLVLSLPFTSASLSEYSDYWQGSVVLYNNAMPASSLWCSCQVFPGQALLNFICSKDNGTSTSLTATDSGYVYFSISYFA